MGVWAQSPEEGCVKRLSERSRAQIIGVRKGLLSAYKDGEKEIV